MEELGKWALIQKRTFTAWVNSHLRERVLGVKDLFTDLSDGEMLINLLEIISAREVARNYHKKPKMRAQKLENCSHAVKFVGRMIKLVGIGAEDIADGKPKLILGFVWCIILRWQIQKGGGAGKDDLLKWVRSKIPECNIQDFTNSWRDGKAICHLTDALERGTVDLKKVDSTDDPLTNAVLGEQTAERELDIPMILAPEDMVCPDIDELSVMTYISYFRDYELDAENRREKRRLADANKSLLTGPTSAEQFTPLTFLVTARNCFSKDLDQGGHPFEANVKNPQGVQIDSKFVDNNNGTYTLSFLPLEIGKHSVNVSLSDKPLSSSPLSCQISKSSMSVDGPGLSAASLFVPTHFAVHAQALKDIKAFDKSHLLCRVSSLSPEKTLPVEVQDTEDGVLVKYTPEVVGRHRVQVDYLGLPISESPYLIGVVNDGLVVNDGNPLPNGTQFVPYSLPLSTGAFLSQNITISPSDIHIVVTPTSPEQSNQKLEQPNVIVKDEGKGRFKAEWVPLDRGSHNVSIKLKDVVVSQSPFQMQVDPSPIRIEGQGVEQGEVIVPSVFTIDASKLISSNPSFINQDQFHISVSQPEDDQVLEHTVRKKKEGIFEVSYTAQRVGDHRVVVALKGRAIGQSPYRVPIGGCKVTAHGPGLENAEQFIAASFFVDTSPLAQKDIEIKEKDLDIRILNLATKTESKPESLTIKPQSGNRSTFVVEYVPSENGPHEIDVRVKNQKVVHSPFKLTIDKARTDGSRSIAYGKGIESVGNFVDQQTEFTIESRNKVDQPREVGGDHYEVEIQGPRNTKPVATTTDLKNGKYSVVYTPYCIGEHLISARLKSEDDAKKKTSSVAIKESPFKVQISRDPNGPDPNHFLAHGSGLEDGNTNVEPATFIVEAFNGRGERLKTGGLPLEISVVGPTKTAVPASITDKHDGSYVATYSPVHPGLHKISVVLKGSRPEIEDPIKGSPFQVQIKAGTDAAMSTCKGPGLKDAFDTKPAHFKIQARDSEGNNMPNGGDPFLVSVSGPSGEVPAELKDNGDGTYDVVYHPKEHGPHTINVNLRTKPVGGGPFHVNVKQAADHLHTFVDHYEFSIRTKTKTGEFLTTGGEEGFVVVVQGPSGDQIKDVQITDKRNGTYIVSYALPAYGDYKVFAKLNGRHIRGSPWKQTHYEEPDD